MSESTSQQIGLLVDLLSSPPPFIYVHDPLNTTPTPNDIIEASSGGPSSFQAITVDAMSCFNAKILFDTIINQLANWKPTLNDKGKAPCWAGGTSSTQWDKTWDTFVGAFKGAYACEYEREDGRPSKRPIIALLINHAERLKNTLPSLIIPLIRIRELSGLPISTIFISSTPWTELDLPMGTCPDPFMISLGLQSKQEVVAHLASLYPSSNQLVVYSPVLKPLYSTFLGILYDSCIPYTNNAQDIAYIAYAMWPTFVRPVLEDWKAERQRSVDGVSMDDDLDASSEPHAPPADSSVPLLIRHFLRAFAQSFNDLYTRTISAQAYQQSQASQPSFRLSERFNPQTTLYITPGQDKSLSLHTLLSRRKKMMLVAGYIASFNPQKTDLRMFGRIAEGGVKKGRKRGPTASANRSSKAAKIPQVLLGPNNFPLERFVAIYGALVTEHGDGDNDPATMAPGELEVEVNRANLLMAVSELVQLRLLHRIGSSDRLDSNLTLKCNVSFETAEKFAKELRFTLSDILWDPVV